MSSTESFYKNEVFFWRGIGAIGVSALLLPSTTLCVTALLNFSIFSPYSWLCSVIRMLLSPWNCLCSIIMCAAFLITATSATRFFTVISEDGGTRLSKLLQLLKPSTQLHIICQSFSCAVINCCMLSIIGGEKLRFRKQNTDTGTLELNEAYLFMVLHAVYVGLLSGICFFSVKRNVMHYPPIQQSVWNASRDHMGAEFKRSFLFVIRKIAFFYAAYYVFLGALIKRWLVRYFSVVLSSSNQVDSLWGLLDVQLFMWTCFTGSLLVLFTHMFYFIYTLYQTEPYEMSIPSRASDAEADCKLTEALGASSFPLLQFQAYQDLYLLSKQSAPRRALLFSLSPLGGHPHNWTEISEKCLGSLNAFTQDIQKYNASSLGTAAGGSTKLSPKPTAPASGQAVKAGSKPPLTEQLLTSMKQTKALSYLLSTPPEVALRQVLAHAQKHAWNVQALSNLVIASYTEDRYGVVQKSLSDVISSLITLRDETEKMGKLVGGTGRWGQEDPHSLLRSNLKASLYSIVATFAPHMSSINLPADVKKRLSLFAEYKV